MTVARTPVVGAGVAPETVGWAWDADVGRRGAVAAGATVGCVVGWLVAVTVAEAAAGSAAGDARAPGSKPGNAGLGDGAGLGWFASGLSDDSQPGACTPAASKRVPRVSGAIGAKLARVGAWSGPGRPRNGSCGAQR